MGSRRSGDRAPDERPSVAIFQSRHPFPIGSAGPGLSIHGRAGANEQHTPLSCRYLKRPAFVRLHGPGEEFATPGGPTAADLTHWRSGNLDHCLPRNRFPDCDRVDFLKHDLKMVSREFSLTAVAEVSGQVLTP
jgi:hypothetical protein